MRPVCEMSVDQLKGITCLLTDIDDTITEHGLLPAQSLAAIERLDDAGLAVVPITGRPAGWCDHIARMWSVRGVVGENGAFYFSYNRHERAMLQVFGKEREQRREDRRHLDRIREEILREVPGTGIASDQDYRVADLAIDFCEDVEPLSAGDVAKIVEIFEQHGATAQVSSIHVNGWFGRYDKLSMTRRCLDDLLGISVDDDNDRIVYLGDSPNDMPMFRHFTHSVGVANVGDFDLDYPPKWVTEKRSASGFVEFVDRLLAAQIS